MSIQHDIDLKLSAQRALLGAISQQLRSVSVDIEPEKRLIRLRWIFDGRPSELERELASVAGAEIISDLVAGWDFEEEVVSCSAPERMQHLRMLVYERYEER